MVVALLNQKGGVGKTALALAARFGRVLIFDPTDAQSATCNPLLEPDLATMRRPHQNLARTNQITHCRRNVVAASA